MRPRLTYANVMVTILAFIVLGGVAVAGVNALKKNSVGAKQLKNGAVTRTKIRKGAVDSSKVADGSLTASDLNPSVLAPYAKGIPYGNDAISPDPVAVLKNAIYNVGGPGFNEGVDCFGGSNSLFPKESPDDISFSTVAFDNTGIASKENPANSACFNGFDIKRTGTYAITAWVSWEGANELGERKLSLVAHNPSEGGLSTLAVSEQGANSSGNFDPTAQAVSTIARLEANGFVVISGYQSSALDLGFTGGGFQIAWIGP
jgi:hypothetical protein